MKLSIIIPIYNVEDYLKRCVESILNQDNFVLTKDNIEIILVNDGSPDNSQLIIDKYVEEYSFIKGYEKSNGGLSDARNFGLARASGDYIWFVDSDDWIDANSLEIIFNELNNKSIDILEFDHFSAKDENEDISLSLNPYYSSIQTESVKGSQFLETFGYIPGVCFKIIKQDLFHKNNLLFPVGELNEDNIITFKLMFYANSYRKLKLPLYYYYSRPSSITNKKDLEHLKKYHNDQLINIFKMNEIVLTRFLPLNSYEKINEMINFLSVNLLFSSIKNFDLKYTVDLINKLKERNIYPIQKYTYHNLNMKRDVFRKIINRVYSLKIIYLFNLNKLIN